jgi:hypothetical protein
MNPAHIYQPLKARLHGTRALSISIVPRDPVMKVRINASDTEIRTSGNLCIVAVSATLVAPDKRMLAQNPSVQNERRRVPMPPEP